MTTVPDKIRSNIISHTVDVHRYEAGLRRKITAMIDRLGQDLVSQLTSAGLDTPRTAWQRARLSALLDEAGKTIGKSYEGVASEVSDEMKGLVQITGQGVVTACNDAFGAALMVPPKWTPELLAKLADETLIQGAPSAEWWARQGDGMAQAFSDQMRQGMLRGETVPQLRDRIMGQNIPSVDAVGKVDLRTIAKADRGIYYTARRNAEALVRTSVMTVATEAHMEAFRANADIMDGITWCATLDLRTCLVAGTPVSTPNGPAPIEQLREGDVVLGGSRQPCQVNGRMSKRVTKTVVVKLSNGEMIRCTPDHLWLDSSGNWVEAGSLKSGLTLATRLE